MVQEGNKKAVEKMKEAKKQAKNPKKKIQTKIDAPEIQKII